MYSWRVSAWYACILYFDNILPNNGIFLFRLSRQQELSSVESLFCFQCVSYLHLPYLHFVTCWTTIRRSRTLVQATMPFSTFLYLSNHSSGDLTSMPQFHRRRR